LTVGEGEAMDQILLFDLSELDEPTLVPDEPPAPRRKAPARASDPQTSHEAAWTALDGETSQQLVRQVLTAAGPCTDEQLADLLRGKMSPSRARTARSELRDRGEVEEAGEATTRYGRKAKVWRVSLAAL